MAKLKSIVFVAGVMLLILAAAMGYLSIKYLVRYSPRRQLRGQRRLHIFALSSAARPGTEHGGQRT